MRFDKQKAFPYPVLRKFSDDYLESDFNVSIDIDILESEITIYINYSLTSKEIQAEIDRGNAEFVTVIHCRDTFFRKAYRTDNKEFKVKLDSGEMCNQVVFDSYVLVKNDIDSYLADDLNPEFGSDSIAFQVGDVLAQKAPDAIFIHRDLFKPITSFMTVSVNDRIEEGLWEIVFNDDYLDIQVSSETNASISGGRNTPEGRTVLINSLFFSAAVELIQRLKTEVDSQYDSWKYKHVILHRLEIIGINLSSTNEEASLIVQKLLGNPFKHLAHFLPHLRKVENE